MIPLENNVMIVEDNQQNQLLLAQIVKQLDCKVFFANNGKEAIENKNLKLMDLILLDINMPLMNGYQFCEKLKEKVKTKDIPVIFISALSGTKDVIKAFDAGGVDYIPKPFQIEEVKARVNAQLLLKQKSKRLEQTLQELIKTQKELLKSKKLASLGVLTAGLAHEINNPINFIYAGIKSLEQDYHDIEPILKLVNTEWNCECREYAQITDYKKDIVLDDILETIPQTIKDIQHGARRASEIIKGLKFFFHPDTETKRPTNIHHCINSSLALLKNRLNSHIKINKNYYNNLNEIMATSELYQVFVNIINNAIDAFSTNYIEQKGDIFKNQITISTKQNKNFIEIIVKDNGHGISGDILENIFDPFFTTKKIGEGTGLGLSISYGIIQKHNGEIDVASEIGKGTTFKIKLPV